MNARIFSFILLILCFSMCKPNKKSVVLTEVESSSATDSILITYLCGSIDTDVAISCEKFVRFQLTHSVGNYLFSPSVIDTFIVDRLIVEEVKLLLSKLQPTLEFSMDARMYVALKYKDGTADGLCIGMNMPKVIFNGEPMLAENKLIYLLRRYSGYYQWFDQYQLTYFKEYIDYYD